MAIKDLFLNDVTRDIAPVVYFYEQTPEKVAAEVGEYIITGGWPESHPNHKRVPNGIHEQYVRLLTAIKKELDKPGGPELPTSWISGFYGSGKSSFAKLLGLALDGLELPGGKSLADAWLRRDTSPKAAELEKAWSELRQKIDPISIVFDVGSIALDNEHVHSASVRQLQRRLGYCKADHAVCEYELKLERDGLYDQFLDVAEKTLGRPWDDAKNENLADDYFSEVISKLFPTRYEDPQAWLDSHGGKPPVGKAPQNAADDIRDMLKFRSPQSHLFMVVDEVSQYVHENPDRQDRLRAFASALGATLKGKAWLLALGQQKLDEDAGASTLVWARDRFPPHLRVDLAPTNIRDVVHKRLLQKNPDGEKELRKRFDERRPDLKLYAYGCSEISAEQFIETYPMLPEHIGLLLRITSALRARSTRSQGDDQAIRGLLQLLGELFRAQKLADREVGALVTLDLIYEIQHTALDSDTQSSMSRIMNECAGEPDDLKIRAAKAVALLELIQETEPTTAELVSQCLYDSLDRGNQVADVTDALEWLLAHNLLGYSEKLGYKIQSTAGEEWERTKREIPVKREDISEQVQEALKYLIEDTDKPKHKERAFPLGGIYSDSSSKRDEKILDPKDDASIQVDFRFLPRDQTDEGIWRERSKESQLEDRLIWVCGDLSDIDDRVRQLVRCRSMIAKFGKKRGSLTQAKQLLLGQEEVRLGDLQSEVRDAVASAWRSGNFYFQGETFAASEFNSFNTALTKTATNILATLFPHFDPINITPGELSQLTESELNGPSVKFTEEHLGILEQDSGRFVPSCTGVVPRRIQEHIENEDGISGVNLLQHFGRPPYGYRPEVVKACVAGLLRGSKIKIQSVDAGGEITAIRDAGVTDLFGSDRIFKRSEIYPVGDDDVGYQARAKICRFLAEQLKVTIDREDHLIADEVAKLFPQQAIRLREVMSKLTSLPNYRSAPSELTKLQKAIEACVQDIRRTKPTVAAVKRNLDALRDGIQLLNIFEAELDDASVTAVRHLHDVHRYQLAQLRQIGDLVGDVAESAERIDTQLEAERPWREINSLRGDIDVVTDAYQSARQDLINQQEQETEAARGRLKTRPDFSRLSADQSHSVLRILDGAADDTSVEAVAPALGDLRDPFTLRLGRAEEAANDKLDEILSEGDKPLVQKVSLNLNNREVKDEADVDALLKEIRLQLIEQL
ncbi:MAG: BREX system P-loop protein BrxC, partial [Planctomycetota bacterium]